MRQSLRRVPLQSIRIVRSNELEYRFHRLEYAICVTALHLQLLCLLTLDVFETEEETWLQEDQLQLVERNDQHLLQHEVFQRDFGRIDRQDSVARIVVVLIRSVARQANRLSRTNDLLCQVPRARLESSYPINAFLDGLRFEHVRVALNLDDRHLVLFKVPFVRIFRALYRTTKQWDARYHSLAPVLGDGGQVGLRDVDAQVDVREHEVVVCASLYRNMTLQLAALHKRLQTTGIERHLQRILGKLLDALSQRAHPHALLVHGLRRKDVALIVVNSHNELETIAITSNIGIDIGNHRNFNEALQLLHLHHSALLQLLVLIFIVEHDVTTEKEPATLPILIRVTFAAFLHEPSCHHILLFPCLTLLNCIIK